MNQQQDPREFVHRIDSEGRIRYVNDAWMAFAVENGWPTSVSQVLGSVLMEYIADPETRHIYALLIDRARVHGRQARFNYRCDSPDCRRFMEMRISYNIDLDQVEFHNRVLHVEKREPVSLLDTGHVQRTDDILRVCSWCKAVWNGHAWVEVEQAVERLETFAGDFLPRISHGICPDCSERMTSVGVQP